ncbi:integumentary mucin C.1-like [Haliotis rubra]|uniref:integumentary mucin C.1-like n=1 Tax=Haliotis rubra TaxID=36100 RepID=UPI001EE53317|nr:integumentary mucin C.1-like [Haliotis rubra]
MPSKTATTTVTAATTSAAPPTTIELTTSTTTAPTSTFKATAATTSAAPPTTLEVTTSTTTAPIPTFTATAVTTSAAPPTTLEVTMTTSPMSTSTTSNGTTTSAEPTTSAPTATSAATTTTAPYNGTCVTDIDCAVPPGRTCSGGVCICSIGYDMDETSVTCRKLTECSSFGSGFILYVDKVIKGYAVYKSYTTPADCARLCLNATSTCRSFEMQDTVCFLQAVTWFSVPNHKRVSFQGVNHYQRRCAW